MNHQEVLEMRVVWYIHKYVQDTFEQNANINMSNVADN